MSLTQEQGVALTAIYEWLKDKDKWCFKLAGFAGVGKTFLLQHFINEQNTTPICMAPTGKAASVLGSKLNNVDVRTIHSVMYQPNQQSYGELLKLQKELANDPDNQEIKDAIKQEKKELAKQRVSFSLSENCEINPGDLCVVDEASMVDEYTTADLEKTGAKVLFVYDPGQIPPVKNKSWVTQSDPDVLLSEIQRQAMDSPIIRLSMEIRSGIVKKSQYTSGDCIIMDKSKVKLDQWLQANQILTGRNRSRHRINRFFRKNKGFDHSKIPVKGDKLICLKNDQTPDNYFINGVLSEAMTDAAYDDELRLDINYDGRALQSVPIYDYHCLDHYDNDVVQEPWFAIKGLQQFDYAYAITVHKSQGSEWPYVVIADDNMMRDKRKFRQQWLYTAITRAKEKLLWVQE